LRFLESGSVTLIFPAGLVCQRVGLDVVRRAEDAPRSVAGDPARKPRRMLSDDAPLKLPVLLKSRLALGEALAAITRDRLGLGGALGLHRLLGLTKPHAPVTAGTQPLGQLVTARVTEQLVLSCVQASGFLQDLLGDLLIGPRRVMRRRRRDLRAINGDNTDLHHAGPGAQLKHPAEQLRDRRFMPHSEPRDRRVIRDLVGRNHPERDIVTAVALDAPRRPDAGRVGVDEQRNHHRRIMRRPTMAILTVITVERIKIKLIDGLKHKPRQMALRQPLLQARRQQQLLITIAPEEVLRHALIVFNPPDGTRPFARHPPRVPTVLWRRHETRCTVRS
jgi:hypothetical protein